MSGQHTPAPWHISPLAEQGLYGNRGELAVIGPDERICTVDLVTPAKRGQEYTAACPIRDANARLIAASPELLDLAYQYMSDLRHPPTGDSIARRIERAEKVIAKATAK